ncbi:MAG: hypothetical protein RIR53_89 [Bacteroidota bacterium]
MDKGRKSKNYDVFPVPLLSVTQAMVLPVEQSVPSRKKSWNWL